MKEIQSTSYQKHAEIAQLVEHNLCQGWGRELECLVFRSSLGSFEVYMTPQFSGRQILSNITYWRGGGIGRRATLRG